MPPVISMGVRATKSRPSSTLKRRISKKLASPKNWRAIEEKRTTSTVSATISHRSLAVMASHVEQVQQRLGRPMLVENISAYVGWAGDTLAEPEFFNALTRRSGCGLLLDVNNLFVNARNEGLAPNAAAREAMRWVDAIRPGSVGEIHLAGHCERDDGLVIDFGRRIVEEQEQPVEVGTGGADHLRGSSPDSSAATVSRIIVCTTWRAR